MEDHWIIEGMYLEEVNIVLVGPPSCFGFLSHHGDGSYKIIPH